MLSDGESTGAGRDRATRHDQALCPFCRVGRTRYWYTSTSKSDGKPYPLHVCLSCRGAFVFPIPSEEDLARFYRSSSNSMEGNLDAVSEADRYEQVLREEAEFPNSTLDAQRIAAATKELLGGRGRVLDVGSGYGFFSRALIEAGLDVDAIELNAAERMIYARMNGFEPLDSAFNSEFVGSNAGKYDAVLLSQVLEHLPMCSDPIRNIHGLLRNGGIAVIAVPHFRSYVSRLQGKRDMFITPPEHLNFFTIDGLTKAFVLAGFETLQTETISRYDYNRLRRKLGAAAILPNLALRTFLRASDRRGRGMFINAYFRKVALKKPAGS